ncbi:MAG: transcriptional regulator [Amycolatopsis sp.]|jgi:transcriptional regulator with XRE-family HTH domain|uniref:helix-turn-helix transcriptional regulator n=1 Tax=Amycolatopsis sp. TaxID=37632 RepID=UPI00260EE37C|nr:helix-turn-helix transcriptional regulator [Amycolatopsis sp.]MCU1684104.1 transcriptional regulator [Amycolatopsis sp.]
MDRVQLADFLRSRRTRLTPSDVGLPVGVRRRTPGLRREEVAELAAISVDYYTRLEQARGPHPSRQVLGGIQRALRLSDDEREHLFRLAGEPPGPPAPSAGPPGDVRPGIRHLLDRLDDAAAFVLDAKYEVIAWNQLACALMGDFAALAARDRNLVRRHFLNPAAESRFSAAQQREFGLLTAGHLRSATARYPQDPGLTSLIDELLRGSDEFAEIWATHHVDVERSRTKILVHPVVGVLEVDCEVLLVPERDQQVIIYTAAPGTPSSEGFQRLRDDVHAGRLANRAHLADRAPHTFAERASDVRGGALGHVGT